MARPASTAARASEQVVLVSGGRGRPEALVESYRRLAEVFHEVLSEQELDALLDRIADTLSELMPYEALHIYEAHEESRELVPVHARSSDYEAEIMRSRPRYGEGITGWAVEHRRPVWTNRAHLDPRAVNVPGTPVEAEALISVPLIARGALKGALNIYRIGGDAEFFEHEFELAKSFGDAAALALDNAQIRARLEHAAQTDSLTGLYNHRYFHERLRAELMRASRSHDSVAVLMFDIDDFKRVNDIYGHGAGDQLLVQLARIAREIVRASDVVCRLGGEEFGVIMPSCDAGEALGLAARLQDQLRESEVEPMGGITVSVGIAQGPQHAMNPRELVACAEAAMMTAKAQGKNGVVLFDDDATMRPGVPDDAASAARDVRSLAHMKLLQSLTGKLNCLVDVRQIAETIATELRLLIDYHNCRVFLREGDELRPIAFVGDLDERAGRAAEAYTTRVGVGITGRVVSAGQSLLVPNAVECEFGVRIPGTQELDESLAAVPLRYGSRVTGAIVLSKLGLNQFDEDDVRLLEVLAGQASVALENARLYEAQRRDAENARALLLFAEAASRAHAQDEIARETVDSAARLLGRAQAALWLADDDGRFRSVASHGCAETFGGRTTRSITLARADVQRLLGGRLEPFFLTRDEALARVPQFSVDPSWLGVLIAPLLEGDGVAGWLVVRHSAGEVDPPTGEDAHRLAAGLASQASVALQKARLYSQQREAAEVASALLDASRELATAEGSDEVLSRIVDVTCTALAAADVSLWLQTEADPHALERCAASPNARPKVHSYSAELVQPWLERDEPFVVTPTELAAVGVDSARSGRFAIAPIRIEGNRLGALIVDIESRPFADRQLKLLAGLAHQAKLALENAAHFAGLERTFVSTVEALANALEAKDEYASTHARWITDMALLVGRELELDRDALKRLELGALFHDIGKIGIPSSILQKPGPLTDDEFRISKEHPELGEKILAPIDRLADVRPIVRACHERWDGGGYPDGKAGSDIPIEARIVLVCDAFHAMTTDRPYRGRLDVQVAIERLRDSSGAQFDPCVVDAFTRLHDDGAVLPLA